MKPATLLPFRDAMQEWAHVPSDVKASGTDTRTPDVTIVITTFKRSDFLAESVASALQQRFSGILEIIVVDNDPETTGFEALRDRFPELASRNYRYFVHRENIGMFGNFNRGIMLARGQWVTILNDDDLLDDDCIALLHGTTQKMPAIDGLFCERRVLDQRPAETNSVDGTAAPAAGRLVRFLQRVRGRLIAEYRYALHPTRRIPAHMFFWGSTLGAGLGFLFRRNAAIQLGGYAAEQFPSSDHYFHARFAQRFHLRQHRALRATYRIARNESAKVDTIVKGIEHAHRLQLMMLGTVVPAWWKRFIPLIIAGYVADARNSWGAEPPIARIEKMVGFKIREARPQFLFAIRIALRGL